MAKNGVQFQRGLSLGTFSALYGTEAQCEAALFQSRWFDGFLCPRCGGKKHCRLSGRRYQCAACKHQSSLTAGTLFHSTKLPLTQWFLAIHLMTSAKNGVSQLELGRQVGVSVNTAALMYHKIAQTMLERDESNLLAGEIELDDAYWGGKKAGAPGRASTNKIPFVAAVEKRSGKPHRIKLNVVSGFSKEAIRGWSKANLTQGSHGTSDALWCFLAVKDAGCTHTVIRVGNSKNPATTAPFNWVNTVLGNLKTSLKGTFHKLAPHHLERHLAAFVYRFNRRYHLDRLMPRFLYAAATTIPFQKRLITQAEYHG